MSKVTSLIVITVVVMAAFVPCVVLAESPTQWYYGYDTSDPNTKALYHLDETSGTVVHDAGNVCHLNTLEGTPAWKRAGKFGGALEVNEGDVVAGSYPALQYKKITLEAWVNHGIGPQGGYGGVICWFAENMGYELLVVNSHLMMVIGHGDNASSTQTEETVPVAEWHHVAGTYNDTTREVNLYIDGVLKKTAIASGNILQRDYPLVIGNRYDNGRWGWPLMGLIDEVRISDTIRGFSPVAKPEEKLQAIKIEKPPVIDGKIEDDCWRKAAKLPNFILNSGESKATEQTIAYVAYDDNNLYIAFECQESQMDNLLASESERDGSVWRDDSVEVFLDTSPNQSFYYHFVVNSIRTQFDEKVYTENFEKDVSFNASHWRIGVSRGDKSWFVEMAIAFQDLDLWAGKEVWRLNLNREEWRIPEYSSWSCTYGPFHNWNRFGYLTGLHIDDFKYANNTLRAMLADLHEKIGEYFKNTEKISALKKEIKEGKDLLLEEEKLNKDYQTLTRAVDEILKISDREEWVNKCQLSYKRMGEIDKNIWLLNAKVVKIPFYKYMNELKTKGWKYGIVSETPMRKVLRAGGIPLSPASEVSISLCKNEHEGLQLVLVPFESDLRNVKIKAGDLIEPGTGKVLSGENINLTVVGYVGTKEKGDDESAGRGKLVPDPLLGVDSFDVRKDELQPVWVDVYAPADTQAGLYEGTILVEPEGMQAFEVKLNVRVWDFTLPQKPLLRTHFGALVYDPVYTPYGVNDGPMLTYLMQHRLSPGRVAMNHLQARGYWEKMPEFSEVEPIIDRQLTRFKNMGFGDFMIEMPYFEGLHGPSEAPGGDAGVRERKYTEKQKQYFKRYYRDFSNYLEEKGWLSEAYVYLWDEPHRNAFESIREINDVVKEANPKIRRLVVTDPGPELDGYVDIWVANTGTFDADAAAARQKAGDEVWFYVCSGPEHPYANFAFTNPEYHLIEARLLFWMTWKYNIDGFLYWFIHRWPGRFIRQGNSTDCWWTEKSPFPPGDGVLTYPGERNTILSSIRMEAIRDGVEDYEYLFILRDKVNALKEKGGAYQDVVRESEQLLQVGADMVKSLTEYTDNPKLIYSQRERIASQIEKISKIIK